MKVLILLLSALAIISATRLGHRLLINEIQNESSLGYDSEGRIVKGVYATPLDHFSPTDHRQTHNGYEANVEFFKTSGPLFFFIDFHDTLVEDLHKSGLVYKLARGLNGAVVSSSPRFIGDG